MTDGDLVHQTLAGERSAYGTLVKRYAARVLGVCHARVGRAAAAEDLAQETLVRGLESLPTLAEPEKFAAWICGIAARACLDWLKRAERRTVSLGHSAHDPAGGNGHAGAILSMSAESTHPARAAVTARTPADDAQRRDDHEHLLSAVEQLPAALREAIMLYYYEDCTYDELAGRLGVSAATINARLTRARQALRAALGAPLRTRPISAVGHASRRDGTMTDV